MKDAKTHINVRLSPAERKQFRVYCAMQGVTAQDFLRGIVLKTLKESDLLPKHLETAQ